MKILFFLFFVTSCAKFSYIVNQGVGQLSLEWNGRDNEDVLKDKSVKEEYKEKIRHIQAYKKFFFDYFDKESNSIYDQTTFLKSDAVTYLVIASPYDKIHPLEHSFPIVGKFPYLGFFSEKSAIDYRKELENDGYEVFMRSVFAYSTLNQWIFNDNILSSFFHYNEHELAELIFHELFHTIFFIKDEVNLNENLAQLFASELAYLYFKFDSQAKYEREEKLKSYHRVTKKVAELANELKKLFAKKKFKKREEAVAFREGFLQERFFPVLKTLCQKENLQKCWPLEKKWNNAQFAAFLTYEGAQNELYELKGERSLSEFLEFLQYQYTLYKKADMDKSFETFLLKGS